MSYKEYTGCKYIDPYINKIKNNEVRHCPEQEQMIDNIILPVLARDDVYIDEEKIEKGLELQKYFWYKLIEWEIFLFALIVGVLFTNGDIFFKDIRAIIGRGAGKNGFISFLIFYFISPFHGIQGYNVDIIANSEDQAKVSFDDIYNLIKKEKDPQRKRILDKNFSATKTVIECKKTSSKIRYNSSSTSTKDSKRTGAVIFDEKHEYKDRKNINTLSSGLGKVPHGRKITITTNGHIRDGVLDKELEQNKKILKEYNPKNRTLVFWCYLINEQDWNNPDAWIEANPSINDFPELKATIEQEVDEMPYNPDYYYEFMAKRMNHPVGNSETEVASWEDIVQTNKPLPDLYGKKCVLGIDYAKTTDFVGACLLFKDGEQRYAIVHGWMCAESRDWNHGNGVIKAPIDEWAKQGLVTVVDNVEINADYIIDWILEQKDQYGIVKIAMDSFRFSYLNMELKKIGFDANEKKNVKLIRPSDLMKSSVTLNSIFINHNLAVGDNPYFRWNTNNVKKSYDARANVLYGKIEPRSRKTDAFMAFANAVCVEDEIPQVETTNDELIAAMIDEFYS